MLAHRQLYKSRTKGTLVQWLVGISGLTICKASQDRLLTAKVCLADDASCLPESPKWRRKARSRLSAFENIMQGFTWRAVSSTATLGPINLIQYHLL